MKIAIVIFLLGVATDSLFASDRGLAWSISKDGRTSYGLGSVHLADASFYPLNSNILQAYDASEVMMVEADETKLSTQEQAALLEQYGMYPEGESFRDHVSDQLAEQITAMFGSFGIDVDNFGRYRPAMLGVTMAAIQAQVLGYSAQYGLDGYFLNKARFKKEIIEIESFEQQMQLISRLPESEEVLRDAFLDMADFEESWGQMMQAWKDGDGDRLYQQAIGQAEKDFPSLKLVNEQLFYQRNVTMAAAFERCFKRARCFMIVGAGHFVGPRGINDLLVQRGYKIEQLP